MTLRRQEVFLVAVLVGCTADHRVPCARAGAGESRRGLLTSDVGYDVIVRGDGALVVDGTGPLPWRVLYAAPRNCAAPGEGAGNPILRALVRSEVVELDIDGCGEEVVVAASEAAAADLARRVGAFLARRRLRERVAIFVSCEPRGAEAP